MRQIPTNSSNGIDSYYFLYFLPIPANKFMEHFSKFKENIGKHSDATLDFGKKTGRTDGKSQTKDDADEKAECLFPCLMVTCGSGCPIIKVNSYTGRTERNDL